MNINTLLCRFNQTCEALSLKKARRLKYLNHAKPTNKYKEFCFNGPKYHKYLIRTKSNKKSQTIGEMNRVPST